MLRYALSFGAGVTNLSDGVGFFPTDFSDAIGEIRNRPIPMSHSWKVRTFSHARSYFRSKAQRKTRFPLVLCSLIRNFAQNLCENGLHLGKERALCTRFAPSLSHAFRKGCRSFCCSISLPNLHLERDFYEQNQYYIEAVPYGADFNHSSIGAVQGPVENMGRGLRFLYAHTDSAPPYQTLMRKI